MAVCEITCYKTHDGKLFEDFDKAQEHETDLVGQEVDNLCKVLCIDLRRNGFQAVCKALSQENRKALTDAVASLHDVLGY